jgi:hypothetical protein
MCYNPAKSWQLRWYDGKRKKVNLMKVNSWSGKLIGVDDFKNGNADSLDMVTVKLEAGRNDYYIGFNRKQGINRGTVEYGNRVIVESQIGSSNKPSTLRRKMVANRSFSVANYKGTGKKAVIKVGKIDNTADPPYAKVTITLV